MSLTVDAERRADAHERRNTRARARLALAGRVSALSYEGLTVAAISERLGCGQSLVYYWRKVLGWDGLGGSAGRGVRDSLTEYPEDRP